MFLAGPSGFRVATRFLACVLTMFRSGVPPNMGQDEGLPLAFPGRALAFLSLSETSSLVAPKPQPARQRQTRPTMKIGPPRCSHMEQRSKALGFIDNSL